jgi:hypothetical protein
MQHAGVGPQTIHHGLAPFHNADTACSGAGMLSHPAMPIGEGGLRRPLEQPGQQRSPFGLRHADHRIGGIADQHGFPAGLPLPNERMLMDMFLRVGSSVSGIVTARFCFLPACAT